MRTLLFSTMILGLSGCFLLPMTEGRMIRRVCELHEECPEGDGDNAEVCEVELEIFFEDLSAGECRDAIIDLNRCLARLNCDDFDGCWTEPVEDYPCFEEDIRLGAACFDEGPR